MSKPKINPKLDLVLERRGCFPAPCLACMD